MRPNLINRLKEEWNNLDPVDPLRGLIADAIDALVEQPAQQEPVAYAVYHRMGGSKSLHWSEQHSPDGDASQYQLVPLFTSPAQRKPLTDEEIEEVWRRVQSSDFHDCVQPFARAIEAAHGIKGDA